jgi:hypothetical protein
VLDATIRPTLRKNGRDGEDPDRGGAMSTAAVSQSWSQRRTTVSASPVDARRALQLSLAGLWLLDGVLQLQPFMFTKDFARTVLAPSANGNPAFIAAPITSIAHLVAAHSVGANAVFALTQLLLGLGIAWRPTVKTALVASIAWALGVWWLGEGLGGVLTGHAGLVAGGPGAALLYAVLAVLLWPSDAPDREFAPAGALGATRARIGWAILWTALAGFAIQGSNRSAQGLHDLIAGMAFGQPSWLAAIDNATAGLVADRGLGVSIGLAIVCAAIAATVFGSPTMARVGVITAIVLSLAIWVTAQALGGLFGSQGTDPNTGPLLIVIALAYWPRRAAGPDRGASC